MRLVGMRDGDRTLVGVLVGDAVTSPAEVEAERLGVLRTPITGADDR